MRAPRYIIRVEGPAFTGYKVSLGFDGLIQAYFSDARFGAFAREHAAIWLSEKSVELFGTLWPPRRIHRTQANNSSGVVGVFFDRGSWVASWCEGPGSAGIKRKRYAGSKYGEAAYDLACEKRREMVAGRG